MRGRTRRIIFLAIVFVCALAANAWADTNTSLGNQTGEGSTPFTGLAQAPEANLYTGALTTSVNIEVPPGRKNMTPKLTLQYSSAGGQGIFGVGWNLPIGQIERSTKWGTPRCNGPHTDDFVLTMPEGMVELVADPPGSDTYRPKVEENYVRATKYEASNYWVVYDRSGMRYEFGGHNWSRLKTSPTAPFMEAADTDFCEFTTAWALTRMEDPNGNTIDIDYWNMNNQLIVPNTIKWGGNSDGLSHLYQVRFWPLSRPDNHESHRKGVTEYLNLRIDHIVVSQLQPSFDSFRTYTFAYDEDGENDGYQSRLSSVQATGYPPQFFVYEQSEFGHGAVENISSPASIENLRDVDNDGDVQRTIMDMNGDGKADLLDARSGDNLVWWIYLGGEYGGQRGFEPNEANKVPWSIDQEIGDRLYGAGKCGVSQTCQPVIRSVDDGCDDADSCVEHDTFDITGDGVPDFVLVVDAAENCPLGDFYCLRVFPGNAPNDQGLGARFGPGMWWPTPERYLHKESSYSPPGAPGDGRKDVHVFQEIIDINGDGLPDLVVSPLDPNAPPYVPPPQPPAELPYQWQVYLNTGYSFDSDPSTPTPDPLPYFAAPSPNIEQRTVLYPGTSPAGHTSRQLMDFNGDGLLDYALNPIVGPDSRCDPVADHATCLDVYLNTGQGFSPTPLTSPLFDVGSIRRTDGNGNIDTDILDMNGDGLPDRVWVNVIPGDPPTYTDWVVGLNRAGKVETDLDLVSIWPGLQGPIRHQTTSSDTTIDMIDINQDGMLDHVEAGSTSWTASPYSNNTKPNLLTLMQNGIGGITNLRYAPSTTFVNDGGDGIPDLPFVTWVVTGIHQTNGLCVCPGRRPSGTRS